MTSEINNNIHADRNGEPSAEIKFSDNKPSICYVGFWARVMASLVDTVILILISWPLLLVLYGKEYFEMEQLVAGPADFLISWVFPVVAVASFWFYKQATPGKMLVSAKIVDAKTGNKPTKGQCILRYFGYFLSVIPFGYGMLCVGWDKKKQGWHDKLASTVVIRESLADD
ncbi:RDD family protein [Thalassomonas actiniarum]|uniref:RDD family protein n=1 Tax=Thalassomonas actiniarum TaxID=485447 RepID=A0AAF0C206_9GAMM|nr:RDD family protein [Thalassomonas actiniarum]WDD97254.1 RDD family protein [Thalassomonas actiniarum]